MRPILAIGRLVRPRRGRKRAALLVALVIAALWLAGLVDFAARIPDSVGDPNRPTDAIVVLTGGSKRLQEGLQLLGEGKAQRLFVSGVHQGVQTADLLALASPGPGHLACCIDIGHGAENTAGNAAETAAWMRTHGYRSLRLVTSSYHMPRSLLEFRHSLPETTLIPHPVFPDRVETATWWRHPGTAALLFREYGKYMLARVRHAASGLVAGG